MGRIPVPRYFEQVTLGAGENVNARNALGKTCVGKARDLEGEGGGAVGRTGGSGEGGSVGAVFLTYSYGTRVGWAGSSGSCPA